MISCQVFHHELHARGIEFYSGVPDSLLKDICAYISDHVEPKSHVISANEGTAVALAAGHYLATGKTPLVYMQNSGLGNSINPLLSLVTPEVYGVPVLLLIGWRGEPGVADEPQHVKQGEVTPALLETMGIPHFVLSKNPKELSAQLDAVMEKAKSTSGAVAILVRKESFEKYSLKAKTENEPSMTREEAIHLVASKINSVESVIISTTGKISRELEEYKRSTAPHLRTFFNVGSMGHASQIALGVSLGAPKTKVYCFDGDGSAIMHLGGLAIAGAMKRENFFHIIFNNSAHESVGGQPTVGDQIDWLKMGNSLGYASTFCVSDTNDLSAQLEKMKSINGPCLLEVKVKVGSRSDLGRPKDTPFENKVAFMKTFQKV